MPKQVTVIESDGGAYLSLTTTVEVAKVCNRRRERRWTRSKCVSVVDNASKVGTWHRTCSTRNRFANCGYRTGSCCSGLWQLCWKSCWCKCRVWLGSGIIGRARGLVLHCCILFGLWHTVWRNYVCDAALPRGFARPRWKVRLRSSVPLGEGKHAGVNAACRWGAG